MSRKQHLKPNETYVEVIAFLRNHLLKPFYKIISHFRQARRTFHRQSSKEIVQLRVELMLNVYKKLR